MVRAIKRKIQRLSAKSTKFRPVPLRLKQTRYGARHREFARFYALYLTMTKKRKRASFSVKINPRLSGKQKQRYIIMVINALNDETNPAIPVHRQGDVFSSFPELLEATPWIRIRKLLKYKAGVTYER